MPHSTETIDHNSALTCPVQPQTAKVLALEDELLFPLHKRAIVQYALGESGARELFIFYDDKEISFDEPALFAFGETLAKQARFAAKTALSWGEGYQWQHIQPLLEQLIDEGILHYADLYEDDLPNPSDGSRPSPLPPAQTDIPRNWLECETISQTLTGKHLDLAHLELVIPVFRVAHIALDAEGRQVGEANVFPKPLRLDIATDWRSCPFPGSRFQDERPMNVTALKSMRAYWPQMMAALLRIRSAYLQRYPEAQQRWTVGGLEALSTLVLAVPTYALMRNQNAVANGQLHPALSSLFRVTDGLRIVMHQMIFIPVGEPTLPPSAPMTSQAVYDYCERNFAFSSEHGVCAGPKVMIEEFLDVLVNGKASKAAVGVTLEPEVESALAELDPAFDYGLYGLQAYAAIFSIWPVMTRTYQQLWQLIDNWSGEKTATLKHLHQRLNQQINILNAQTYHAKETWRRDREQAYSEIYAHCARGLGLPNAEANLNERIQPILTTHHAPVMAQLEGILNRHCGQSPNSSSLLICLMNYFLQVQAIVTVAETAQQHINQILGRDAPQQSFDASQINIHNLLQGDADQRLAYLTDLLEDVFNVKITINKDRIMLSEKK